MNVIIVEVKHNIMIYIGFDMILLKIEFIVKKFHIKILIFIQNYNLQIFHMRQQMNIQLNFGILYMNMLKKIIYLMNNQFNGLIIIKL